MKITRPCRILAVVLAVLTTAGALLVAAPRQDDEQRLTLGSVEWLAGHWRVERNGSVTEELWMPARGKLMLGLNRSVRGTRKAQFEYLRIEERKDGVFLLASPSGAKPTPFELIEADEAHAVFTNPEHDFPKRIEYRLAEGRLTASIAGDDPGPSWTFELVSKIE